jgi:hypothetical protein
VTGAVNRAMNRQQLVALVFVGLMILSSVSAVASIL